MSQQTAVSTVIEHSLHDQQKRNSLPIERQAIGNVPRRARSIEIVLQPPILENDEEEDAEVKLGVSSSTRTSFTKKPPSRSNGATGLKVKKILDVRTYDNAGFEVDGYSNQNFQRGFADSTRSSTHDSVLSLQVQREQYCCCSRWTVFERRLAMSVGVLAGVIFGLAIAVGILARNDGIDQDFIWKP